MAEGWMVNPAVDMNTHPRRKGRVHGNGWMDAHVTQKKQFHVCASPSFTLTCTSTITTNLATARSLSPLFSLVHSYPLGFLILLLEQPLISTCVQVQTTHLPQARLQQGNRTLPVLIQRQGHFFHSLFFQQGRNITNLGPHNKAIGHRDALLASGMTAGHRQTHETVCFEPGPPGCLPALVDRLIGQSSG